MPNMTVPGYQDVSEKNTLNYGNVIFFQNFIEDGPLLC